MRYTLKAGMLYKEDRQAPLIRMKGVFSGPEKNIYLPKMVTNNNLFTLFLSLRENGKMYVFGICDAGSEWQNDCQWKTGLRGRGRPGSSWLAHLPDAEGGPCSCNN